jgi:hypothetical protein
MKVNYESHSSIFYQAIANEEHEMPEEAGEQPCPCVHTQDLVEEELLWGVRFDYRVAYQGASHEEQASLLERDQILINKITEELDQAHKKRDDNKSAPLISLKVEPPDPQEYFHLRGKIERYWSGLLRECSPAIP